MKCISCVFYGKGCNPEQKIPNGEGDDKRPNSLADGMEIPSHSRQQFPSKEKAGHGEEKRNGNLADSLFHDFANPPAGCPAPKMRTAMDDNNEEGAHYP